MKKYRQIEEKLYPQPEMDIVSELEAYRLEHKISQQQLAEKLGVAFSTVNRWLNGKARPNKIQTYHIKKILEKHIAY